MFPTIARLVLAGRFLYSTQFGTVPVFSVPTLALNTGDRSRLGGFHTMRGFVDQRFVGESAVLANAEVRWSLYDGGYLCGQHLRPMIAPFVDAGPVFDGRQLSFDGWRADGGIRFRRWVRGYGSGMVSRQTGSHAARSLRHRPVTLRRYNWNSVRLLPRDA